MLDACVAMRGSYDNLVERADGALKWLVSKGVRVDATRTQKLMKSISQMSDAVRSGKAQEPNLGQLWEISELDDLIQIATQLEHIDDPRFLATLAKVTGGPHLLEEEKTTGGSIQGRNATFELFAAARFTRAGLPALFKSDADATIETPLGAVALECKRIAAAEKLERNIGEAASQIMNRISNDGIKAGIVCVSLSRLVHQIALENRGNIFADTSEFRDMLRAMLASWGPAITAACGHLAPSVLAIGMHYKLPFIDKSTCAPTMLSRFMLYNLLDKTHQQAMLELGVYIHERLGASTR
ncbi:hypothetical protein D769_13406 [Cupriavidus sp. HMR-1]|nr:hypothetical protein D769_13406 [Cupriavidus sp. HMR-1]